MHLADYEHGILCLQNSYVSISLVLLGAQELTLYPETELTSDRIRPNTAHVRKTLQWQNSQP